MPNTTDPASALRLLRMLANGEFHAARSLAEAARLPVGELRPVIERARAWGATIGYVPRRGYRLEQPIEWLDPMRIREHLGEARSRFSVHIAELVESTNTELLHAALAGAPSGTVLAAEVQTRGRGRRGRAWHSGLGGALTWSLLWRFDLGVGALAGLGLAVSLAVLRALRELGASEIMLKWPNDVLWRHRKLAGVLIELQGEAQGPSAAVIGIGLNVCLAPAVRERVDQAVTDLASIGVLPERNRALGRTLAHLAEVLDAFAQSGFGPMRGEWERAHALAGRAAAVALPDQRYEVGRVAGVGDDGALLLQTASGLRRLHSGEVSLRPLEGPDRLPRVG